MVFLVLAFSPSCPPWSLLWAAQRQAAALRGATCVPSWSREPPPTLPDVVRVQIQLKKWNDTNTQIHKHTKTNTGGKKQVIRTTGEQKSYLCLKLDVKTDDQSTCGWQQCHLNIGRYISWLTRCHCHCFSEVPIPPVACNSKEKRGESMSWKFDVKECHCRGLIISRSMNVKC